MTREEYPSEPKMKRHRRDIYDLFFGKDQDSEAHKKQLQIFFETVDGENPPTNIKMSEEPPKTMNTIEPKTPYTPRAKTNSERIRDCVNCLFSLFPYIALLNLLVGGILVCVFSAILWGILWSAGLGHESPFVLIWATWAMIGVAIIAVIEQTIYILSD